MDSGTPASTVKTPAPPVLKLSIRTPAAVSALAFGKGSYLAVGAGEVSTVVVDYRGWHLTSVL